MNKLIGNEIARQGPSSSRHPLAYPRPRTSPQHPEDVQLEPQRPSVGLPTAKPMPGPRICRPEHRSRRLRQGVGGRSISRSRPPARAPTAGLSVCLATPRASDKTDGRSSTWRDSVQMLPIYCAVDTAQDGGGTGAAGGGAVLGRASRPRSQPMAEAVEGRKCPWTPS